MDSMWLKPELADEIIKNDKIFDEIHSIIADILINRTSILQLVNNMRGVLTSTLAEEREKGLQFFTKVLKELPNNYLDQEQIKYISSFYSDRLKDVHRMLPLIFEAYLVLIDMKNYRIEYCEEFFTELFKNISCQMQLRQERANIYLLIKRCFDKNVEYIKTQGMYFTIGVIQAMDGERDPRNLLFMFSFLPRFIKQMPLGHLEDEMFNIISCYYPIDFYPKPDDPAAVTRQDLADALAPCLCAIPQFANQCLVLLIEKLDSSLRVAKLDSLRLLIESCKTFEPTSFIPFLKALWSSLSKEIENKSDEELKITALTALSTLVTNISLTAGTDQSFENFVKGILISTQKSIAESMTVSQYVQSTRILSTVANASKPSCIIITRTMIPSTIAYYDFKMTSKLQIASLVFLGNMYDLAKEWKILNEINDQLKIVPRHCLVAISVPQREFQVAGFKTLIKYKNILESDLVVPLVEVLVHNVQQSQDNDLLSVSVEAIHAIAGKYPELIMDLVVKGKCDLENLTQDEPTVQNRLNLLSNLASIDEFTKIILEEMLKLIQSDNTGARKAVEALSVSISNTNLFPEEKINNIQSDHGLIESVLAWLFREIYSTAYDSLSHAYTLVSSTMSSLPAEKQMKIISTHTKNLLHLCRGEELYFVILDCLYNGLRPSVYDDSFLDILNLCLRLALSSQEEDIRTKACSLAAHFLNKAEVGVHFEPLYEQLTKYLSSCKRDDESICPRLIILYGWVTKGLLLKGSDLFGFWLKKITKALLDPYYCVEGAKAMRVILTDYPDHLTKKRHCKISLLHKQRIFQTFLEAAPNLSDLSSLTKESNLLSWSYVVEKTPKNILNSEAQKIIPLIIESLEFENEQLLIVMLDKLGIFAQSAHLVIADSLQTILPRLLRLSRFEKSMEVRIASLNCIFCIASAYRTSLLLPYKQDVLLELAPSLDDKKRLVRNMAVKARTRWFLIGAPGEAKDN